MRSNKNDKSRRLRVPATALALTLALSTASAAAASICTVNVRKLNVRAQPNTDSAILTVVRQGAELPLVEDAGNGWYKVEVNGGVGYVFGEYATVSDGSTQSSGGSQSSASQSGGASQSSAGAESGVVTADKLNVRGAASTSGKVLGTVRRGTALTILAQTGDWLQINYNGVTAYVSAAYVNLSGASSGGSTAAPSSTSGSAATSSALSEGSRGDAVKDMQARLIALGYLSDKADGIFGPKTKKAVIAFQSANGLTASGVADAQTLSALNGAGTASGSTAAPADSGSAAPASSTALQSGSTGDDVRTLQRNLITLGYLAGTADGVFGPATQKAVATFQAAYGLTADGIAGAGTLEAIQKAVAKDLSSGAHASDAAADLDTMAAQAVANTNAERAKYGLKALKVDADLTEAAKIRAREIVKVFDHIRPDGSAWFSVSSKVAGENLAYGTINASAVVTGWMNSESHRAAILDETFNYIGIACVQVDGVNYWAQLFGR